MTLSDPVICIAGWWLAFAFTHMVLSSSIVRPGLVARLGEGPFAGLYSLVALACFIPLVRSYFTNKHAGPWLWSLAMGPALEWAVYIGMGAALVLVVAGLATPSPAMSVGTSNKEPAGVLLLTRHPVFMGLGLFGLLHLLPNGAAADLAFFGGFPLFAVIGARHQDHRKMVDGPHGYASFCEQTPFLPFTGGRTIEGIRGINRVVVLLGISTTLLLRHFHAAWFGG